MIYKDENVHDALEKVAFMRGGTMVERGAKALAGATLIGGGAYLALGGAPAGARRDFKKFNARGESTVKQKYMVARDRARVYPKPGNKQYFREFHRQSIKAGYPANTWKKEGKTKLMPGLLGRGGYGKEKEASLKKMIAGTGLALGLAGAPTVAKKVVKSPVVQQQVQLYKTIKMNPKLPELNKAYKLYTKETGKSQNLMSQQDIRTYVKKIREQSPK